jgi:hypothetical protein
MSYPYSPYVQGTYPQATYVQGKYSQASYPQAPYAQGSYAQGSYTQPTSYAQGPQSRKNKVPKPPPANPPQAVYQPGIPIHICSECSSYCVRCSKPQQRSGASRHGVRSVLQNQINVCTALTPRSRHHLPPEIEQWVPNFDWTLQLSHDPRDPSSWLFDEKMLIAVIAPMVGNTVGIRKAGMTPGKNNLLTMSRVNIPGPNQQYVVCA